LENKINSLEEELKSIKYDSEHLEMIYKVASYNEGVSCNSTNSENCEALQEKIKYLMKIVTKLSLETANLNVILVSKKLCFQ